MLLSIGGILGSVCSAYFTEYLTPSHTFLVCSALSLIIVIAGYYINPAVETGGNLEELRTKSLKDNVKRNISEIKEAMKQPVIYKTIGFFLVGGLLVPSFGDINYYFVLSVVQFSKFTFSLLNIVAYFSLFLGILLYNRYFKHYEVRTLLKYSFFIAFGGQLMNLVFVLRLNQKWFGVGDVAFTMVTTAVTDTLLLAFTQLPTLVLFVKITPAHIEATVFAVLTGVFNFVNTVLSPNVGVLLNKWFVGVSSDHLEKYYILALISLSLTLTPLLFIRWIPSKSEVETQ